MVNSSGRWNDHVEYITNKARKRIFFLKRLKMLGASENTLREVYFLFIRSILEFSAPLWTGALTENKRLSYQIQRVQNHVCRVIRPDLDSTQAEIELGFCSLESRRLKLARKCANQMLGDPQFKSLFKTNEREASRNYGKVIPPRCNRKRYQTSSIPFFSKILGQQDQYSYN